MQGRRAGKIQEKERHRFHDLQILLEAGLQPKPLPRLPIPTSLCHREKLGLQNAAKFPASLGQPLDPLYQCDLPKIFSHVQVRGHSMESIEWFSFFTQNCAHTVFLLLGSQLMAKPRQSSFSRAAPHLQNKMCSVNNNNNNMAVAKSI